MILMILLTVLLLLLEMRRTIDPLVVVFVASYGLDLSPRGSDDYEEDGLLASWYQECLKCTCFPVRQSSFLHVMNVPLGGAHTNEGYYRAIINTTTK